MMGIEDKIDRLSPEAQDAVMAFVDFLLSREEERYRADREDEENLFTSSESVSPALNNEPVPSSQALTGTGIILAEEREIEKDDAIDFADINTRFSKAEEKKDPPAPIRQKKTLDWL